MYLVGYFETNVKKINPLFLTFPLFSKGFTTAWGSTKPTRPTLNPPLKAWGQECQEDDLGLGLVHQ